MAIIYSKSSGKNDPAYGKIETPIKMVIEHESDLLKKQGGPCDWLFNVEKSTKFAETVVGGNEFDVFQATAEGGRYANDAVQQTFKKIIEHIQFTKVFTITREMAEDANFGVAADAKLLAQNFVRAYYATRNKLAEAALANGASATTPFGGSTVDLTTGDGQPLFSSSHTYGAAGARASGTQANFFWGDIFQKGASSARAYDAGQFELALTKLGDKVRNMKDENGDPLGYTADTIILPGNRPVAESIAKKVAGSNGTLGTGNNDINIHYGNWNIFILPHWQASDDRALIMSSEANKQLCGNLFFNRVDLDIRNWIDELNGNFCWSGRTRLGIGFGSYKHILLAVDATSSVSGATQLT